MPYAPYRLLQVPGEPRAVIAQYVGVWGRRRAKVSISENGENFTRSRVGITLFPKTVADVFPGAARPHIAGQAQSDHWRIDCEIFSIRWPEGFTLESTAEFPPPFELVGDEDARLWIQGPVQQEILPSLAEMKTEDQTITAISTCGEHPLVEMAYEFDGQQWLMIHVVVNRDPVYSVVVSGQAPQSQRENLLRGVELIATSFVFHPLPSPNVTG